jgi:hypothetical protein
MVPESTGRFNVSGGTNIRRRIAHEDKGEASHRQPARAGLAAKIAHSCPWLLGGRLGLFPMGGTPKSWV